MKTSHLYQAAALVLASAAFAGCSKQARETRRAAQADKDFAAGDYDKAEVEYRGALQLANDPKAIGHLGVLYFDEGRTLTAFRYLRAGAHQAPQLIDVRVKLGLAYLQLGSPKDAREIAKGILGDDPANAEALLLLMDACRTKQDVAAALDFVEGLRQSHPDAAGYHLALGMVALFQGNQPNAESELRQAIALDPKSSASYLALGNLFVMRRDAAQAGEAYKTATELAPLRSSTRLRYVDFLLATKKRDEAKAALAEINTKTPDYIPGLVYSMQLALTEHRYADCEDFIQKILMRDPQNYEAMMERGAVNMAQGNPAKAVTELTKAEEIYPHSPQIKYQLAIAYLSQGDMVKGEDRLNQAISADPNFDQAKLLLAKLELRKGDAAAAVALLTAMIEHRPQMITRAYPILAQAYIAEKNPDQALATYRKVAVLSPNDPQVPYLTGVLFAQQNQPEYARVAFEKALQIAPSYAPALDMLVNTDLSERHIDAADALAKGLIGKYPKAAGPWLLEAKVDLVRNNLAATESDLLKAIELEPGGQAAYLELAQVYVSEHKTAEAVKKLQVLADKTPSPRALMLLGVLQSSMKQYEAAAASYEKILTFDPKFAPALNNLAYLYSEHLGKLEPGYDYAKRARDADPDSPNAADTLGWILYRKGDFRHALDLVQECLQKDPGNIAAEYHLGMIYYMLGEEDLARQAFQHVVGDTGADAISLADARSRLALLAIDPERADPAELAELETRAGKAPDDPVLLARLSAVEARQGASAGAAEHFEEVLKLTPENARVMMQLAQLYAGPLHAPDKARTLAKRAHQLAPNDAQISATLGRLLYRTGDYGWSLDLLRQAAQNMSGDADLQYDLALAQYSAGRVSDAESTLNDLMSGGGTFAHRDDAARLAAMIAAGKSPAKAEAALPEAKRILANDPTYLPAMAVSAMALEKGGDASAAAEAYENILVQDPIFSPATRELALIYAKQPGSEQKAYDMAVKAREAFPEDATVATALGIADYRRKDYEGAVRLLQDSLRRRADDAETTYYLGMSHLNLRQAPKAKAELKHALELGLHGGEADDAKSALAGIK